MRRNVILGDRFYYGDIDEQMDTTLFYCALKKKLSKVKTDWISRSTLLPVFVKAKLS